MDGKIGRSTMVDYRHINQALGDLPIWRRFSESYNFMSVVVLVLSLMVGCSINSMPVTTKSHNEKPPSSSNNASAVGGANVDSSGVNDQGSKTSICDHPEGYGVEEVRDVTNAVRISRDRAVLHVIKLPTVDEVNGFGFDWAKKTKEGFEIAVEYGSRIYYGKRFIFICRNDKFYLSKIRVDSFDKHNPEKWSKKVIKVKPNLPLEKFSITDFMVEGVVQP